MSGLFGGGDEKQTIITTPGQATQLSPLFNFNSRFGSKGTGTVADATGGGFSTGFGNDAYTGMERFDVNNRAGIGRIGAFIGNLSSNQNPFIQARVNPLRDSLANQRADLSRGLSLRGVQGSLSNNEMIKFDNNAGRQLGDASALATQEALQSMISAEGLGADLNSGQLDLANEYLKRDLSALGLNMDAVRLALSGRLFSTPGQTQTSRSNGASDFGGILSGVGSVLGGIGDFRRS